MINKLSSSQEDYLEAIYIEQNRQGAAKVTDIAKLLNVKKASVTGALAQLAAKGLINYAPYSPITLTEEGEKKAEKIFEKHQVMTEFFKNVLKLPTDEARVSACEMEHILSEKLFARLGGFITFIYDYSDKNKDFKEKLDKIF